MKISHKTDYCLKIILDLSHHFPHELVNINDLAERQDIPRKFLEQLLLLLKNGGFITSKRGPKGGYSLSRSPSLITLGQVVRFTNGSVYPIECIDPQISQPCDFKLRCVFSGVWKEVGDTISGIVDAITFASLIEKENEMLAKGTPIFHI